MELSQRGTQTQVKHWILDEYLKVWTYIITNGLKWRFETAKQKNAPFRTRFVYVDCFANVGKYAPENGQTVYGSPIIGIERLDFLREHVRTTAGFDPSIIVILIESDAKRYEMLLSTLDERGYAPRIKPNANLQNVRSGDIVTFNGDCLKYLDQIVAFTSQDNFTWSFYFLDPYGPTGIPLKAVERVISQRRVDSIINLPYSDLHAKTGSAGKAEPDPRALPHLGHYDSMYGGQQWRQIAVAFQAGKIDGKEMEKQLVDLYYETLQAKDTDVVVKRIPQKFEERERTHRYLILTTHDPNGALTMNQILDSARNKEFDLREERRVIRTQQLTLFETKDRPEAVEPDSEAIALQVYSLCKGERLEYRDVLKRVVNFGHYPEDMKSALRLMRKQNLAIFEGDLTSNTKITFKQ